MGGKLTSGGIKLPGTGDFEQTKIVKSVDGKEADETGNINLGGAFDFVDKKTQIRGCKALTWNTLRIQGIDDWEKYRDTEFSVDEESLTVSTLTGDYIYIAEVDSENKSSAYYRSDNAGATYSRHIVPTEGVDVKLIRTSETGQVVLLSTHIGGVLVSEDYGKTWIIPHSLGNSTSNSDSSWFISMSSNGQNLIYPNSDGDLYLENSSLNTLVLPTGVTPNSIKEFFVSNHTDRANIKMVMMTRNGNVYTSVNGGVHWSHAISGVNGMYTDKDVERIYVIKGTTVQYRNINGTGFSTKVDFKTYPKYQDLTRDPNDFQLRSIFVSHDYGKDKSNIAVFTVNGNDVYGGSNKAVLEDNIGYDVVEGEDVLSKPYAEKPFTGILISEDSGDTWDLSQIKYTWGTGTPFFEWPGGYDQVLGYPRLQLIENFESGLLIYSQTVGISNAYNNIIRICDKSTSYSSTSKMILDGGITLGQSMEADTEYYNKMPGTIEYENFRDGFIFHFDKCTWTLNQNQNGTYSSPDSELLKPLTITGNSNWFGKKVKTVEFSHTLKDMERINTKRLGIYDELVKTQEFLILGPNINIQNLLDDGYTEDEAYELIAAAGVTTRDIASSGIKPSDITSLDDRVTVLENSVETGDDSRVSFIASFPAKIAYTGGGGTYINGYALVDSANQVRVMGHARNYRFSNPGQPYTKFFVINLPNHDNDDKIISLQITHMNLLVVTESGKAYISGYNGYGGAAINPTPTLPNEIARNTNNFMTQVNHNVGIKKMIIGPINCYQILYIDQNDTLWGAGWNPNGWIFGQNKTQPSYYDMQTYGAAGWPSSSYNSSKQMIKIMTGVKDAVIGGVHYGYKCIKRTCYAQNFTTYVLKKNGDFMTCGYNGYGQRGTGDNTSSNEYSRATTGVDRFKVNYSHNVGTVYAIKGTTLYSWGFNQYGQTGYSINSNVFSNSNPNVTQTMTNVRDFWCTDGDDLGSSFVAKNDGTFYVAGYNGYGQLGTGNTTDVNQGYQSVILPTSPKGLTSSQIVNNIIDLKTAARYGTYILYKDSDGKGKLLVSGYNRYGQLGLADKESRNTFQHVVRGPNDIKEIQIFSSHNHDASRPSVFVRDSNNNLWHVGATNYYLHNRRNDDVWNFERVLCL